MILKNIIIVSLVISASFLTLSVKADNSDSLERLGEVDPKSSASLERLGEVDPKSSASLERLGEVDPKSSAFLERLGEVDPKSSYDALNNLVCQYFSIGC